MPVGMYVAEIVQHSVYYNRLLELFIADDHYLSPSDFLDSMEANGVKPDPVIHTYMHGQLL